MKIHDYPNFIISNAYIKQSKATPYKDKTNAGVTSEPRKAGKDEVLLSSSISEVHNIEGLAKALPDLRQDKVEATKALIESNTYNVTGKLVAQSIADLLS